MRPTEERGTEELKIERAAPADWSYSAGDTIIGSLIRHTPIVAAEATLTLGLVGRASVKINKNEPNGTRFVYTNQCHYLRHRRHVVFRGPLHLPAEGEEPLSWQFEFEIPLEAVETVKQGLKPSASFLPLDSDSWDHHVLPRTFIFSASRFVEYYLHARLHYNASRSSKTLDAFCPIVLRPPVTQWSGNLDQIIPFSVEKAVRSQRLVPGMEDADLSLKEKALKFFGSSKIPELRYKVTLSWPMAIQLGDPSPLPLCLDIVPVREGTSDSIKAAAHKIRVHWVRMDLLACTSVVTRGRFSSVLDEPSTRVCLGLERAFGRLQSPLEMTTSVNGHPPVNLGNLFQLVLTSNGLMSGNKDLSQISRPPWHIFPDFVTYPIMHTNKIEFKICLEIAGETQEIDIREGPVKLVASP